MFSAPDYAVRFAQLFAQILLLLAIILMISRTPEFLYSVKGVGVTLTVERENTANSEEVSQPGPATGAVSPAKECW
jgi:hypothetical protein